ncbi:hypothetical protein GGE06_008109 [Streptomyces sp. SFB5A]|uniref:Uncharacterized protein n=1 Tax=Streptomyces nymphaeiformis TaxID=2663842 RepID=A0A7W7XGA9_9ACTN|nr:hypothetical protein [Streptomyces nymphaeiformis]
MRGSVADEGCEELVEQVRVEAGQDHLLPDELGVDDQPEEPADGEQQVQVAALLGSPSLGSPSPQTIGQGSAPCRPRSGPYADQPPTACPHRGRSCWSAATRGVYHQHSKNLLVSYSPKELGFF